METTTTHDEYIVFATSGTRVGVYDDTAKAEHHARVFSKENPTATVYIDHRVTTRTRTRVVTYVAGKTYG